ncbi:hypothetical protein RSK20926_06787 [Roseobacter sp. SK209-2-6]|uniref:hypothetical protein n=1 Tax=Roseobacter sp. SK209-2-6 TaxID=388739 RepID=UPI0000F3D6B2|nr:hypothetical protein [Roseobacter sp. SK209-2-6]EBA17422.1 hypothetical protein RSK20926_06787 [Roseobacter sp. SK209-2-6]
MTSPHLNPEAHGIAFGAAVVTVDQDLGDCIVRAPRKVGMTVSPVSRRFNSLDEIEGARTQQLRLEAGGDAVAGDIARALKFAAQQLASKQGKRR